MKKIFVVLNGANATNTIAFACYLAGFTKAQLIGVFPEAVPYAKEPALKQVLGMAYVETIVESDLSVNESHANEIHQQQQQFSETCESKGIPFRVFSDDLITAEELITESRFADLIVIDTAADVRHQDEEKRTSLTKSLLANAECPVMIAPAVFAPVEEIIFCYDGSASAVFAMKQLTYLLPGLEYAKATALQVGEEGELRTAENSRVREWLIGNYNYLDIVTIKGPAEKELYNFLLRTQKALVVMGAYGRSLVSRFFHQSTADQLIEASPFPVFITHY